MRLEIGDDADEPVVNGDKPHGERRLVVGRHRPAGDEAQPVAVDFDDPPAGAAKPRVDAENANRLACHESVITPLRLAA